MLHLYMLKTYQHSVTSIALYRKVKGPESGPASDKAGFSASTMPLGLSFPLFLYFAA